MYYVRSKSILVNVSSYSVKIYRYKYFHKLYNISNVVFADNDPLQVYVFIIKRFLKNKIYIYMYKYTRSTKLLCCTSTPTHI